jgi:hypothetical protein
VFNSTKTYGDSTMPPMGTGTSIEPAKDLPNNPRTCPCWKGANPKFHLTPSADANRKPMLDLGFTQRFGFGGKSRPRTKTYNNLQQSRSPDGGLGPRGLELPECLTPLSGACKSGYFDSPGRIQSGRRRTVEPLFVGCRTVLLSGSDKSRGTPRDRVPGTSEGFSPAPASACNMFASRKQ